MRIRFCVILLGVVFMSELPTSHAANKFKSYTQIQMVTNRGLKELRMNQSAERLWRHDFQDGHFGPYQLHNALDRLLPSVLHAVVQEYLSSPGERCAVSNQNAFSKKIQMQHREGFRAYQLEQVNKFLGRFIELKEVTNQEALQLQEDINAQVAATPGAEPEITSIVPNLETGVAVTRMKVAQTKTPVGLYKAVYGRWPDLDQVEDLQGNSLEKKKRAETIRKWEENPWLPLVYLDAKEEMDLAQDVSLLTGRKISVTTNALNEYARRGRQVDGAISASTYFFGEAENAREVQNHAVTSDYESNHGQKYKEVPCGVNQAPVGRDIENYKNREGFIHPSGLVSERSPVIANGKLCDGVVRGGSFYDVGWYAKSSHSLAEYVSDRYDDWGSRLAEAP